MWEEGMQLGWVGGEEGGGEQEDGVGRGGEGWGEEEERWGRGRGERRKR